MQFFIIYLEKKAVVNKPEIIFQIPKNLDRCQTKLYVSPELNKVEPILEVKAPTGYGLDDGYDFIKRLCCRS